MDTQAGDKQWTYRINVQGRLDESWSHWLSGMSVAVERMDNGVSITTLTGPVADQSALRGILNRLWDLNLTLISVNRVE
ncbi:MAG: hypothetical protein ACOX87_12155 [Chloroflexota bacterium]|jgi:hypothetical protein